MLFHASARMADQRMITLHVIDADDRLPLPGVVVRLVINGETTGQGGVTDEDGDVRLSTAGTYRLQLLGYEPRTVDVEGSGTVAMTFGATNLEQANIVRWSTRSKIILALTLAAIISDEHG